MIRALVLTHGRLGESLVEVVELLLGPTDGLVHLSNRGLSGEQFAASVAAWLEQEEGPSLLLVDDRGGSCATAARIAGRRRRDVRIVCGVNLAMLLAYTTWRESQELPDLVRRLVNAGRDAIVEVGTEP
ncbi:MAG: hypothetical protein R6X25_11225 [Candidatus Krumholzibacteriia bacterium]